MIKVYGALAPLAILIIVSHGQDYLGGGYVGSGDYSDIGQYFTDPIFYSPSPSYTSSDPAINEMQNSMDRSRNSVALGSVVARPISGKTTATLPNLSPTNIAGRWHLELSDGKSIDLDLYMSGARIFGSGSLTSAPIVQKVIASGAVSGSRMTLDVVPESGTELYAISLDINRLYLRSPYNVFRSGAKTGSGTVRASRVAAGS
ncbi:MAG: hypothetical protein WB392_13440 [Methanotrichaceae archaeon]